jgi:hypothetical protein
VAVVSSSNVWAVGNNNATLSGAIVHWNGTTWKQVPGSTGYWTGVAATSPTNAWAVGEGSTPIVHWNGTTWTPVSSPSGSDPLNAVTATSATNAWAVGSPGSSPLILHWNGKRWTQVPSPGGNGLAAVTAISATNAWAVGCTGLPSGKCGLNDLPGEKTLILHWNGKTWKQVPSPSPGGSSENNFLTGVAATSATNAWAVGDYFKGGSEETLIVHWNGTTWKQVPSPNPGAGYQELSGVAATSPTSAWAVGDYTNGTAALSLIVRWNGTTWKRMARTFGILSGVAAPSSASIWAVGAGPSSDMALHHC